jgi:hypothetical protein
MVKGEKTPGIIEAVSKLQFFETATLDLGEKADFKPLFPRACGKP